MKETTALRPNGSGARGDKKRGYTMAKKTGLRQERSQTMLCD